MNAKLFYYQDILPAAPVAVATETTGIDDGALVARIIEAYQRSTAVMTDPSGPIWSGIFEKSREIHDALVAGDTAAVTNFLRRPHTSNLLYGFEMVHAALARRVADDPAIGHTQARWAHDVLVRVAEVTGAIATYLPEVDFQPRPWAPEQLIEALERVLGCELRFPNIIPHEWGCVTQRGLVSYRTTQAIYQAWRLRELRGMAGGSKCVEIGAGLGRTAFMATLMGLTDYTLVDLPMANVAQAYFLGRTLGNDRIVLHGERDPGGARVRVQNADWFQHTSEHFDLALNADSMTEMGLEPASRYWAHLRNRSSIFVSMNHEAQSFRVADLPTTTNLRPLRNLSPVRKGYVEEVWFMAGDRVGRPL